MKPVKGTRATSGRGDLGGLASTCRKSRFDPSLNMVVLDDHIRNHVINYSQSSPGGLQGQIMSSVLTLIVGELLKLVLIERLFSLTRDKLMKIPAFAWVYTKFQQAKVYLQVTEA